MAAPYFDTVTSASSLKSGSRNEGHTRLSDLPDLPASKWGRQHLFACQVIRRPAKNDLLPIYSWYPEDESSTYPAEIQSFIKGPTLEDFGRSEHTLVRLYGPSLGQVWAALSNFKRPNTVYRNSLDLEGDGVEFSEISTSDDVANVVGPRRSKRTKRDNQPSDMVPSGNIRVGSSSPHAAAPRSSPDSSVGYVERETDNPLPLEDGTIRLVSCVFRHIFYFAPVQASSSPPAVVEFRDERMRYTAPRNLSNHKMTAIDDGGLCMREKPEDSCVLTRNMVAILEAKRHFLDFKDGRPIISDTWFAQMTCEAIAAKLCDPLKELDRDCVIVVNSIQHYVFFLQFKITDEYLDELDSDTLPSPLLVDSTRWFDLSSKEGREHVLKNLCAMIRWARGDNM